VGVSRGLVQRALAELHGLPPALVAQRMMGFTDGQRPPSAAAYQALVAPEAPAGSGPRGGQPYPFFLAQPLADGPEALGERGGWWAEWKYDGIRAQVVKRESQVWIWSRGEELVSERFPEVLAAARHWPDGTVVDGELLAWRAGEADPAPFALLQSASAAPGWARPSWPRPRCACWPTTCWRTPARTCGASPCTRAAPGWRPWASRPARCWRRTTGPAWPPCAPRPGPTGWRA
jgi:hypothetical protein